MNQIEEIKIVKSSTIMDNLSKLAYASDITIMENFYIDSQKYYEKEFGFPMLQIPTDLLTGKEYRGITVDRAMQTLRLFNLSSRDSALYYYAMLLDALPLPPDIVEVQTESGCEYHFNGSFVKGVLRPSYFYVKELIEHLKDKTAVNRIRVDQFTFYDSIERPYSVNLRRVYGEWLRNPEHRGMINYTLINDAIGNFTNKEKQSDVRPVTLLDKYRMENLKKIRDIMGQNYAIELSTEVTSSRDLFIRYERCTPLRASQPVEY
jgi:hypothetical protein